MIPTREECFNLMDKYRVPIGVRKHCLVVNKVAVFLAKKLRAAGVDIDVNVVDAASMLHDLLRMVNFQSFEGAVREDREVWDELKELYGFMDHADATHQVLKDIYPRIAQTIKMHGVHAVMEGKPKTWEDKVLAYADRRVMHTRVVSVDVRYEDLQFRHADFFEKFGMDPKVEKKKILKLEKEIFEHLKIEPGKKLAKKYHPDINKEEGAESKFKEINEAVSVLADEQKRSQYDQFGTTNFGAGGSQGFGGAGFSDFMRGFDFGSGDFGSIFDMFFGGRGRGRRSHASRGADLQYDLEISLKEAAFGLEKKIPLNKLDICKDCDGKGGDLENCNECGGNGVVRKSARTPFGIFQTQTTCSRCRGSGSSVKKKCSKCDGEGRVRVRKTITVTIPPGVDNGNRLRVRGEGIAGESGGGSGDLYVMIYVKPDKVFKRDGDDLYIEIPISFTQAALGDEIEIPTLNGKAKLKIPSGTDSHTLFKMKGKGVSNLDGYGPGDQMVRVEIQVPSKMNKKQRELVKELDKMEKEKPSKSFLNKIFG